MLIIAFVIIGLVKGGGERLKGGGAPPFPPLGETLHLRLLIGLKYAHNYETFVVQSSNLSYATSKVWELQEEV